MSNQVSNLPPELQARLAQIMAQQQAQNQPPQGQSPQPQAPQTPAPLRQPSLMDHTLALRQEVATLSAQLAANSQVVEAVGQAVGELYQMFQATPDPANQGGSYSQNFQTHDLGEDF